jgi:hypothetical protein
MYAACDETTTSTEITGTKDSFHSPMNCLKEPSVDAEENTKYLENSWQQYFSQGAAALQPCEVE